MIASIKRVLRDVLFKTRETSQLDRTLILQGQMRAEQILARGKLKQLSDAGFGVFSQTDEDGILSWLIERLDVQNSTFIELGVHDYRESNTRFLLTTRNWSGLVVDGDPRNIESIRKDGLAFSRDLQAVAAFITRDNVSSLIQGAGFPKRIGILSLDIDGVDYWVLERIEIDADIIIVEYNDFLGDSPVSVPYSASFRRSNESSHGSYWGGSLAAFRHLLQSRGYIFAGTNILGVNAFFVHSDHQSALGAHLESMTTHRCRMREARDHNGGLAFKHYSDFLSSVAEKLLVRVDTGETIRLRDVARK